MRVGIAIWPDTHPQYLLRSIHIVIMSDDSLDTRSLRMEALTMLKSGEAINKTLKWTMRTKMQTSPCKKVYLDVPSNMNNSHSAPNLQSKPPSPISTPNLDRAMLTHRGISHEPSAYAQSTLVEASASIMALKGNVVPMHFVKDAMVDVIRKEKLLLRSKGTGNTFTNLPISHTMVS